MVNPQEDKVLQPTAVDETWEGRYRNNPLHQCTILRVLHNPESPSSLTIRSSLQKASPLGWRAEN